ncbi:hypothetical protein OJ998_23835 [Solirubrobacter taibaiensis]|nr:hypothetical protein [Solirubrobacter taibaiensis]
MRTVFVFPRAPFDETIQRVQRLAAPTQAHPWIINSAPKRRQNPAIYVDLATTNDSSPLYCDWEPEAMHALATALGALPYWAVTCDITGRIPGDEQIRAFVLALIEDGGVAMDDYSDHCWSADDIVSNRRVDGLKFFDYQLNYERLSASEG